MFYFLRYVTNNVNNASNRIAIGFPVALPSSALNETCSVEFSTVSLSLWTLMENVVELAL